MEISNNTDSSMVIAMVILSSMDIDIDHYRDKIFKLNSYLKTIFKLSISESKKIGLSKDIISSIDKGKIRVKDLVGNKNSEDDKSLANAQTLKAAPDYDKNLNDIIHIYNELIVTEKRYLEVLHILRNIATEIDSTDLPPGLKQTIRNILRIESLIQVHETLRDRLPEFEVDRKYLEVPKVFIQNDFAPFLKMYKSFLLTYFNHFQILGEINKNSKEFREYCHSIILKHDEAHHLKDAPGLFMQCQSRITRYGLIMKEYIKKLPPEHESRKDAIAAMEKFDNVVRESQEELQNTERRTKALEFWPKISNLELEMPVNLEFFKSGPVKRIPRRALKTKFLDRYIFLFNDYLIITEAVNGSGQYPHKHSFNLFECEVGFLKDPDSYCDVFAPEHAFEIKAKETTTELLFANETERDQWFDIINGLIEKKVNKQLSFFNSIKPRDFAPPWIKDEFITMCMACNKAFTVINRKHHCRSCGYIFCGPCSDCKTYISHLKKIDRVCFICHFKLTASKPTSLYQIDIINKLESTNQANKDLIAYEKLIKWAKRRNGSWHSSTSSLKPNRLTSTRTYPFLTETDSDKELLMRMCKGDDQTVLVNYGTQRSHYEFFKTRGLYAKLLSSPMIELYPAKGDKKSFDKVSLLGARVFYLTEMESFSEIEGFLIRYGIKRRNSMVENENQARRDTLPELNSCESFSPARLSFRKPSVDVPDLLGNKQFRFRQSINQSNGSLDTETVEEAPVPLAERSNSESLVASNCSISIKNQNSFKQYFTPVSDELLATLRNDRGFLIVAGNTDDFADYFEANNRTQRDEWISKIKEITANFLKPH